MILRICLWFYISEENTNRLVSIYIVHAGDEWIANAVIHTVCCVQCAALRLFFALSSLLTVSLSSPETGGRFLSILHVFAHRPRRLTYEANKQRIRGLPCIDRKSVV